MSYLIDMRLQKETEKKFEQLDQEIADRRAQHKALRGLPRELREYLTRADRLDDQRRQRRRAYVYILTLALIFAPFVVTLIAWLRELLVK